MGMEQQEKLALHPALKLLRRTYEGRGGGIYRQGFWKCRPTEAKGGAGGKTRLMPGLGSTLT